MMINKPTINQNYSSFRTAEYVKFADTYVETPRNMQQFIGLLNQYITREDMIMFIGEAINRQAWEEYIPDLVAAGLVDTINVNAPVVSYTFEIGFDAVPLTEGAEIPVAKSSYGKVRTEITKFGIGIVITNETIEDVQSFDITSRQIRLALDACRRYEDQLIMKTLINGPSDGTTNWKTGQVVPSHILDANDSDWSNYNSSSGTLDWVKIQVMLSIGKSEDIPYETMVIHPYVFTYLLMMDEFKSSNVWQVLPPDQQETLRRGNMYPIAGLDIVVTPWMDTDKALFLNKSKYAVRFMRRPVSVDRESLISHDSIAIYMTSRMGVGIVNPDAAARLDNLTGINPSSFTG